MGPAAALIIKSASRLAVRSRWRKNRPVTFVPGRARLAANLSATGSKLAPTMRMGMFVGASFAAWL